MTEALRDRLAEIYDVDAAELLPVRGAAQGLDLAMRFVARRGGRVVSARRTLTLERLARIHNFLIDEKSQSPDLSMATLYDDEPARGNLHIVDLSGVEYAQESLTPKPPFAAGRLYIRTLDSAFDMTDAPCGALLGALETIAEIEPLIEPEAIPAIIEKKALAALAPQRLALATRRIAKVKENRAYLERALARGPFASVRALAGPILELEPGDEASFIEAARRWRLPVFRQSGRAFQVDLREASTTQALLRAFAPDNTPLPRRGEVTRETAETKIAAFVDLDSAGPTEIDTGVGFFDHMLEQIAHHAGISVTLVCRGDLGVDAHHTIEDCAIAFGQALALALGARHGIARFGFVLPMDEAEARISVDLGGRAYLVFDGAFTAPLIGAYPTEMTEHVFRSLAQSLNAAIHLSVTGENDHHKTEACYKAFGRALRQAIRIESDAVPSTKGVL